MMTHNHIHSADKETQVETFAQNYTGGGSQGLNSDSETSRPWFFHAALQCLSVITGHDPRRQWCLHSAENDDCSHGGWVALGKGKSRSHLFWE